MKIKEYRLFYQDSIWNIFFRENRSVKMILVKTISSFNRKSVETRFEKLKEIGYKNIIGIKRKWGRYRIVVGREVPSWQRFGNMTNTDVVMYSDDDLLAQKNWKKYDPKYVVDIVDPLYYKGKIISLGELERIMDNEKKDKK